MNINELFFEKLFIDSQLAEAICQDLNIERSEYTRLSIQLSGERKEEISQIKRIRSLYHNKRKLEGFEFLPNGFNSFYKWYIRQYEKQQGCCHYCQTKEHVIATLLEKKYPARKRLNRGNHLEIDRLNPKITAYSPENCVLSCYFCNNDKSDIFDEKEYLDYLKDRKSFLNREYKKLTNP